MPTGTIFITGGAGFLGRGIMRRAQQDRWDCRFVVYSRDEQKHFAAAQKYEARYVIGDILDPERMSLAMSACDTVIHTAALKYIPECEAQPSEAIRINVQGTRCVLAAAAAAGVKKVIIVSTDKACAPINTYGMTKALCERLVFETAHYPLGGMSVVGVRYGNVVGSTGSVWGVFKQQAERDGKLSITDPRMTRYFMSINDAVDVIITAMAVVPAGTVLVAAPKALQLADLAEYLSDIWELESPEVVGRRPGEKTDEEMATRQEQLRMNPFDFDTGDLAGRYYLLPGPTEPVRPSDGTIGGPDYELMNAMSSALATQMTSQTFVEMARDAEAV